MADIKIISPTERYKAIADAIREKSGTTELMQPADMPQAILDIVSGGGGVTYTNIVYNEDNTITLTDKDGVVHTMECEYTDGKLTSVKYDGKAVELTYDDDVLVKIGKTAVDMGNVPVNIATLDHTVTFTVDGEPYEVVSVKDGNQVNEPTEPKKEGLIFTNWNDSEGNLISFPITPTEDTIISTTLSEKPDYSLLISALYEKLSLNFSTHKYITLVFDPNDKQVLVYLNGLNGNYVSTNYINCIGSVSIPVYYGYANSNLTEPTVEGILEFAINSITFSSKTSTREINTANKHVFANYSLSGVNCLSFTVFDDYMSS